MYFSLVTVLYAAHYSQDSTVIWVHKFHTDDIAVQSDWQLT